LSVSRCIRATQVAAILAALRRLTFRIRDLPRLRLLEPAKPV